MARVVTDVSGSMSPLRMQVVYVCAGSLGAVGIAGEKRSVRQKTYTLRSEGDLKSFWSQLEGICSSAARYILSSTAGLF